MRVYLADLRAVNWGSRRGYCEWGIELFFQRHKLDLEDFYENGIEESVLIEIGSVLAMKAVEVARERRRK